MPFMQGYDRLNPTGYSVNTVVYIDVWMDPLVFQNNIRRTVKYCVWYSKHFKAFLIHHTSPIKFIYIHWVFPLENGGSNKYLCIYKYIYIYLYIIINVTHITIYNTYTYIKIILCVKQFYLSKKCINNSKPPFSLALRICL